MNVFFVGTFRGRELNLKETNMVYQKGFFGIFFPLFVIIFDLSLITSNVTCTLTSTGIKDPNVWLGSLIPYVPGGWLYSIFDAPIYYMSSLSIFSA